MTCARVLGPGDREEWAEFVGRATNGTIFHQPAFFDYHPPGRFDNHHLGLYESGALAGVFPAAMAEVDGRPWLRSYPGASWGGLLVTDGAGLEDIERMLDAVLAHAGEVGAAGVEVTLPPQVYWRRPSNYVDFALLRRGFTYRKRELTAVIDLGRMVDDVSLAFRDAARRGASRASRMGVEVLEDPDFSRFYPVLESNLKDRHGVRPTHTLGELERLRSLVQPGDITQYTATADGAVMAGMVMFRCNPRVTLAFYISHDAAFQALRPVNLVYQEVIRRSRDLGYRYLDLGTFTLDMQVNYGLCRFKESFSARGHFRDTFRKAFD